MRRRALPPEEPKKIAAEPELERNLKSVLEVRTAGDPDEEQKVWTEFSPTQSAEQVAAMGTPVSPHVVRDWLAEEGLALHKIAKDLAGGQSPDHPLHPAIPETRYLKAFFCRVTRAVG